MTSKEQIGQKANNEQRRASNPAKSVWVGASAGTGKTKILSDRVLRLLLDGCEPSRLLCLTYTKAAAVEMSNRVAARLAKWAISDDTVLEKELTDLLGEMPSDKKKLFSKARKLFAVLLDTAGGVKIQTIHSFCQEILKRFPLEAKVSPYFEVMDDRNALEAIDNIKEKLISSISSNPDSQIAQSLAFLTENLSEYSFPKVINSVIEQRGKVERLIAKHKSIENFLFSLQKELNLQHLSAEKTTEDFWLNLEEQDLRFLADCWSRLGGSKNKSQAERLYTVLSDKNTSFEDYCRIFLTKDLEPFSTAADKKIIEAYPMVEEIYYKEVSRILGCLESLRSLSVYLSTQAVTLLANELILSYNQYKQKHAKMDYNDIILLTRNLLENKDAARWVLFKLDGGIDHILIDEAQDTSPDQWSIIHSISDEFLDGIGAQDKKRTIFAVGDRKQSIYSFQGADPDKFDEMLKYFSSKDKDLQSINLEVSFRSTDAVLKVVDNLFTNPKNASGVGEKISHEPFRLGEAGKVEFWELIEPEKATNNEPLVKTSSLLAKQIAQNIKQMVSSKEFLEAKGRPIEYGDFLVLVQRRNAFCEELIHEFKLAGVAVGGIDRIKLLEQIAVQDLLSLGKFLLLPDDDLSLAEALKSPLFNLSDEDLIDLCSKRQTSLWVSLKNNKNYTAVYNELVELLNKADFVRPFELYSHILSTMGGLKKFTQRMGFEAEDGLDEFLNLSLLFEQTHIPSMQNFIDWVSADDVEIKRELEQGSSNMVRLMTVHGSKGLQAPIVILPDTVRIPQSKKEAEMLWGDELFLFPLSAESYNSTCSELKLEQKTRGLEEYRRLMYVALTRAEDRLVFCGYRNKNKASEESWYTLFKESFCNLAGISTSHKKWELKSEQTKPATNQKQSDKKPTESFSDLWWIDNNPNKESPLAKPLTPSKIDEEEPAAMSPLQQKNSANQYKRGSIIHKLLQFIPSQKNFDNADAFIASNYPETSEKECNEIIFEVKKLINDEKFSSVFGKNSRAEVPIIGKVGDKIISGQVDRLVIEEDRVLIIDFKTNRPAAFSTNEIPEAYIKQMHAYKDLLKQIYPNKEIITLILWTNNTTFMEVV